MEIDYNKTRYLDKYMKLDNLVYNIVNQEDVDDIKNVIDFAEGLIIKNTDEAEKYETLEMSTSADTYNAIMSNIDDNNLTEMEKQTILKSYKEKNKYYLNLNALYGIDYFKARQAKDFEILATLNNTLSNTNKSIFMEAYHEAVNYYFQVLHTSAFNGEKLYKEYFRQLIVFFAVQKYLTKRMERFFDVDKYTKLDCKHTFISYGIDYFDGLPLTYQRKLIKMLNPIIQYKGTNKCFQLILDAFGFDNVKISKYVLAKDWDNNDVFFYKTSIDNAVNVETDIKEEFDEIVSKDAMWQASKEEILQHDFNTVDSKYIGVEIFSDLVKNTTNTAYFASLIYAIETRFKYYKNENGFTLVNSAISPKPVNVFNAIIALVVLILKRNKMSTKINYNNIGKGIWGFGSLGDNEKIESFLLELRNEIINSKYWLEKDNSYTTLYEFFDTFALETFTQSSLYTLDYIKAYYHEHNEIYDQLWRASNFYGYENIVEKLKVGKTESEYLVFSCLQFFDEKIILNKLDLIDFKKRFPDLFTYLVKYNIYKYSDINEPFENFKRILDNNKIVEKQLEGLLVNINNIELNTNYVRNGFDLKCFTLLKDIIDYNRRDILTSENIDEYRNILKRNPCDILYYEELNCYFELFTQFNIQQDSFYSIDEFMTILKYNLGLKEQLEDFITKTNNYKLYKNYMELWECTFTEPQNMNLYIDLECRTWEEYLMKKDINLYNYTKLPLSIEGNDDKEQDWYDTVIFDLCETLDTFINDPKANYFIENEFIGISEFIKKYITIALMVFKAYTTDIISNNSNYKYDDPVFNTIRIFDELDFKEEKDTLTDNIDLQDMHFEIEIEEMDELLKYTETLKIINVIYETNNLGELIKDIKGNYIEKYREDMDEIKEKTNY